MRGPEEWPSRGSNPADKIRLTDPAAKFLLVTSSARVVIRSVSREPHDSILSASLNLRTLASNNPTCWVPLDFGSDAPSEL